MKLYIAKRLALIPVTLFCIMLANFAFIQFAPGGPVEHILAKYQGINTNATSGISGGASVDMPSSKTAFGGSNNINSKYRGAKGIDPEFIKSLEKQFGFDKPAHERFLIMLKNYASFNFGNSFYKDKPVVSLILERMPISISLGLWSSLIIYLISIPLGIRKALKDGSKFDIISSWAIIIGYAIPGFLFAVLLITLFAGGSYLNIFPLRGIVSDNWAELGLFAKIKDYFWHMCLPIITMSIGGFASLTMLTKNSFLEEINKQYVTTAKAKGLSIKDVLYKHVFRNAMLIVISGFPAMLVSLLFTGSVLIEVIFSLDGMGLLGYEAIMNRDYPIVFASLYIFGLIGLVLNLISDVTYHLIDPRIDFERRYF